MKKSRTLLRKKLFFLDSSMYDWLEKLLYSPIYVILFSTSLNIPSNPITYHCFSSIKLIVLKTSFIIPSYFTKWYWYNHKSSITKKKNSYLEKKTSKNLVGHHFFEEFVDIEENGLVPYEKTSSFPININIFIKGTYS